MTPGFTAETDLHIAWILTKRDKADVKKPTGEVGFFTVPARSWCSGRVGHNSISINSDRSASNNEESHGDRQCKSKPWCSHSGDLEKRMIDKIIMVLKAVIVFLELIRMFF
ncbi:Hypothetical protein ETA_pET490470 (plasmid) [Erwinia tasmaniensis Et1/99]|uniref:Uncharacterized protein n=1 Tax=Erwinia tasmaniensis (strain DSM 17950 / CFBP 7177 / CIP 109463 / NCPPB 4357 / Et1/99) TaxID=465817 RepID=B2VAX0_ERWT9|nr:Hypothetical protein ETA_pET490470 [Erwinia tasmaniensis Et1/99]